MRDTDHKKTGDERERGRKVDDSSFLALTYKLVRRLRTIGFMCEDSEQFLFIKKNWIHVRDSSFRIGDSTCQDRK